MARNALSEVRGSRSETCARLRKTSMDKGLKLADETQRVIDVADLFG